MYSRMIWTKNADNPNGAQGLDNLYSGLLIRLWRNYGQYTFLVRFFKAIQMMTDRNAVTYFNSPNKLNYIDSLSTDINNAKLNAQTAAENFYIAATYAASTDLYDYFTGTLQRSIRQEARTYAINLMATTTIPSYIEPSTTINPAMTEIVFPLLGKMVLPSVEIKEFITPPPIGYNAGDIAKNINTIGGGGVPIYYVLNKF